jgi:streptogramin lyase
MELGIITLCDVSQIQKDNVTMIDFSHVWKLDIKGKCIHQHKPDHMYIDTYVYNDDNSGTICLG